MERLQARQHRRLQSNGFRLLDRIVYTRADHRGSPQLVAVLGFQKQLKRDDFIHCQFNVARLEFQVGLVRVHNLELQVGRVR